MQVIVAVINGEDIVDKILFDEPTEQAALEMAQAFLSEGHFGYCNADKVQALLNEYVIGDYCRKGKFVKARYFAQLDDNDTVTAVERRPANAKASRKKEAEVDQGNSAHCVGCKYVDGQYFRPDPQAEMEDKIVTKLLHALDGKL